MKRCVAHTHCERTLASAREAGLPELAARVVAARRTATGPDDELKADLKTLLTPSLRALSDPGKLADVERAVARLTVAIARGETIGLVTDYDVDGITSHTLLREALIERFGHPPSQLVSFIGHRLRDGYGLSDNLADLILAHEPRPKVVISADCGSSDGPRIARLAAAGIDVIVTDHHQLPEEGPPAAACAVVNPTRVDCEYPDAAIAGCMVAWLLMVALRGALIEAGRLQSDAPKLSGLLDLVALGTVADAVSLLSRNNRAVVVAGLEVMNRMQRPCWRALRSFLDKPQFAVSDLGFVIGPRINARGRMTDPFVALEFLTASSETDALAALVTLDADNLQRRETEQAMLMTARAALGAELHADRQSVAVYHDSFHAGVQGIVASRLVEAHGRPTVVLSPGRETGLLSGSARSIRELDIRAALATVAAELPEELVAFGGHHQAAGLTLRASGLDAFAAAFEVSVHAQLGDVVLGPVIYHDGELGADELNLATVELLETLAPYGRGFEEPVFVGDFVADTVRAVGADPVHLALGLSLGRRRLRAIWFRALPEAGADWPLQAGDRISCAYRLARDEYRGGNQVQLIVAHAAPRA